MHRIVPLLVLTTLSSPALAEELSKIDDANELVVPIRELDTEAREVSVLAGVRGSTSRLPTDSADASPNVLVLLEVPLMSCTSARHVEREADPIAAATEVSVPLGFGGIHAARGVKTR